MFQKGLKDVIAVHTKIASVDGEKENYVTGALL